jgi:peptide/nickel transport system permease protein
MYPHRLSIALVCFILMHITPGDPLVAVLPADASQELAQQLRAAYGFDRRCRCSSACGWRRGQRRSRPFHRHRTPGAIGSPARGRQYRHARDAAAIIAFTFGLLFGLIAGYFRDTWVDKVATSIASPESRCALLARHGARHHLLGELNWLPAVGAGSGGSGAWAWDWEHLRFLILRRSSVIPMGVVVTRTVRADRRHPEPGFVQVFAPGPARDRCLSPCRQNAAPTALAVMGLQLGYIRRQSDRDRVLPGPARDSCSIPRSSSATCRCCGAPSWCWRCSS